MGALGLDLAHQLPSGTTLHDALPALHVTGHLHGHGLAHDLLLVAHMGQQCVDTVAHPHLYAGGQLRGLGVDVAHVLDEVGLVAFIAGEQVAALGAFGIGNGQHQRLQLQVHTPRGGGLVEGQVGRPEVDFVDDQQGSTGQKDQYCKNFSHKGVCEPLGEGLYS